ncbi:uncharacterized protein EHS24_000377 [Apiotrichum porosum]|uniref:Uncharacterized protein n=1 Tax=Apiotrichum porosum TaxID=105984 RepID=A0A427Y9M7_9TREE|nr:uncharacterized protein EHS24_000377 [Apiotrichum porosum]RSH87859.1 hypothetical protein EHS24_000377 [Apiotrichum porosum]
MTFTPETEVRIRALGGTVSPSTGSVHDRLQAVDFTAAPALVLEGFIDVVDVDVVTAMVQAADTHGSRAAASMVKYPVLEWDVSPAPFTPFSPGTPDFDEWDGTIDDAALRRAAAVAGQDAYPPHHPPLTLVFIGHSEGWPNNYFVLCQDPNPENPAVYTTDHEVYFSEVEKLGSLLDLFARHIVTDDEVVGVVRDRYRQVSEYEQTEQVVQGSAQ